MNFLRCQYNFHGDLCIISPNIPVFLGFPVFITDKSNQ